MAKKILLFGAGKSATVLINYLQNLVQQHNWHFTVADSNKVLLNEKVQESNNTSTIFLNIENEIERKKIIEKADVVISMMPPHLHFLIAQDCLSYNKHLLTASYVDEKIKALASTIKEKKLLFLCEMGLDPGIDHMSAMQLIHSIKNKGGIITSFKSHCGGLIAPESDDNPWHYKISWNPKNIILAGKAGASYLLNNSIVQEHYEALFSQKEFIKTSTNNIYSFYPNRDSISYINLYQLQGVNTFVRTTLRHSEFSIGWNFIVQLELTNEEKEYDTIQMTVADFYTTHFKKYGKETFVKTAFNNNETGALLQKQLEYIGLNDNKTLINKGFCSAAEILQFILEQKLALQHNDKDLVVMLHEIEYTLNNKQHYVSSLLELVGEDNHKTAMAKTVGLPLGIAAKLILENKINTTGLHIPVLPEIYTPVLNELRNQGVIFLEEEI